MRDLETLPDLVLGEFLWNFHRLGQDVSPADCIIVLGGPDIRVAQRGAELFKAGLSQLIVCTGGVAHSDDLLATGWEKSEAEVFARAIKEQGVPASSILIEPRATNTGENLKFARSLITQHRHGDISRVLIVVKPHMERRAFATCGIVWPEVCATMTSQQVSFLDYPLGKITHEIVINLMVGDLQRLWLYAEQGFQIKQHIPSDVVDVFKELVRRGYDKHIIRTASMEPPTNNLMHR